MKVCLDYIGDRMFLQNRIKTRISKVFLIKDSINNEKLNADNVLKSIHDPTPFKQKYRRIPPAMIEEVRHHIQEFLTTCTGILRPSHSPFSSNVVLVKKHDGSLRMCVDYRQLNQRTVRDNYALPRIDEILDSLFFSVLDMKSGYHQFEILAPEGFRDFRLKLSPKKYSFL